MAAQQFDQPMPAAMPPAISGPPSAGSTIPVLDSVRLLQGGREILIRHGNDCYRLRHTRNDKLILTK